MLLLPLVFIWSRAPMRYGLISKTLVIIGFMIGHWSVDSILFHGDPRCVAAADSWDLDLGSESDEQRRDSTRQLMREGTKVTAVVGRCSRVGRRWIFVAEPVESKGSMMSPSPSASGEKTMTKEAAPMQYRLLENLALQRIVDAIAQDPNDVRWTITGVITEFSGENWLLLSTVYRAPIAANP